jgi:hypothetical protein
MHTFHRNQNPAERMRLMNAMADKVDAVEDRVDAIEASIVPAGGGATPAYDPGDLTVYFDNGAT